MNLNSSRILSVLPLAIVFFYIIIMSLCSIWIGDDITYLYSFRTGDEIRTFWDVFLSQAAHYFGNNGRTIAHFLVQIVLVFVGKTGFAIMNALINVLFVFLILKLCGKDLSNWKDVALASGLALLVFRTKFVPTCQIGYVWMFCLILGFLLLLKKYAGNNNPGWNWLWIAPFCLIAGWSQESLVIGVGAALVIYAVSHWNSLTLSQWIMIICFGVGGLLLCLSPATIHRTGESHSAIDFLGPVAMSLAKFLLYIRATYFLLIVVLWRTIKHKDKIKNIYRENAFFWNAWAVLIVFNLLVGVFGNRQLFGFELISVILTVKLIRGDKTKVVLSVMMLAAIMVLSVLNLRFLNREQQIYDKVVSEALMSEDGTVFCDLSAKDVTFRETNPSDPFSWYVTGTIDKLLHSQGLAVEKNLRILPTYCKDARGEGFARGAEGTLSISVEKGNEPDEILIKREFNVCGLKIPFKNMKLAQDNPIFENNKVRVFQIYEKVPFLRNTDVVFVR